MTGERESGGLPHLTDAERIEQPRERRRLALLDRGDEICGGFLTHALERGELRCREPVEIGRRAYQLALHQLLDQLVTEPLDVDRAPAGEVPERLLPLRAAGQAPR